MDAELLRRFEEMEKKIDKIYESSRKIQAYFKWTFIVTVIFFVLPLIGTVFLLPMLMSQMGSLYGGVEGLY